MGYQVNDKVVFKTNGRNQVGVVTNRRKSDGKTYYDLRSEAGSGFVLVPVDKARNKYSTSYAVIDSQMTDAFNAALDAGDVTPTNLFAKEGFGHTRANYPAGTSLFFDGESHGDSQLMGHMEKRNDFIFPTQGPRSF